MCFLYWIVFAYQQILLIVNKIIKWLPVICDLRKNATISPLPVKRERGEGESLSRSVSHSVPSLFCWLCLYPRPEGEGAYCFTFVCVCLSVRQIKKNLSQFAQQPFMADAWNLKPLCLGIPYEGIYFIGRQFPVKWWLFYF